MFIFWYYFVVRFKKKKKHKTLETRCTRRVTSSRHESTVRLCIMSLRGRHWFVILTKTVNFDLDDTCLNGWKLIKWPKGLFDGTRALLANEYDLINPLRVLDLRVFQHTITCVTELKRNMNDVNAVGCLVLATTDSITILDTESFKILPDKYEVIIKHPLFITG